MCVCVSVSVWNAKTAWPRMLSAVKITRALTLFGRRGFGLAAGECRRDCCCHTRGGCYNGAGMRLYVFHILNDTDHPTSLDLLRGLDRDMNEFRGPPTTRMGSSGLTASLAGADFHPASPLLDHWRDTYIGGTDASKGGRKRNSEFRQQ